MLYIINIYIYYINNFLCVPQHGKGWEAFAWWNHEYQVLSQTTVIFPTP